MHQTRRRCTVARAIKWCNTMLDWQTHTLKFKLTGQGVSYLGLAAEQFVVRFFGVPENCILYHSKHRALARSPLCCARCPFMLCYRLCYCSFCFLWNNLFLFHNLACLLIFVLLLKSHKEIHLKYAVHSFPWSSDLIGQIKSEHIYSRVYLMLLPSSTTRLK